MALIIYKYQQFDEYDNKKRPSLDKDKNDSDKDKYVSLFPTAFLFPL